MPVTRTDLLEFIRLHRCGVQASYTPEGSPQAALVSFVINDRLELFFDSFDSSRKVANLRCNPRVAFVIGGHTVGDERTVQYEGEVDTPAGAELEELKRDYFSVHPDGLRRSRLPGITYFRVHPRWIRLTDFNLTPAQIVVFEGAALGEDANAPGRSSGTPYTYLKQPWEPNVEREPVFNAFASPQAQGTPKG
jgi:general stress protein 26